MAKKTTKADAAPIGRPSYESIMRAALEKIVKLGGQQGAIARDALIRINTKAG